jgi:uncharacterized protein
MKRIFLFIAFLALVTCCGAQVRVLPKPPLQNGLLYDPGNVLSREEQEEIRAKLIGYEDTTSNQIAVAIIPSLEGGVVEDVANETYRAWGIGTKKNNNGVLLLVSIQDRQVRIEVGYGLEGAITDAVSGTIIRNEIVPAFKQSLYAQGIDQAVDALIKAASGEYKAEQPNRVRNKRVPGGGLLGVVVVIMVIIFAVIGRKGGGGGGGMMSRRGYRGGWVPPVIFGGGWGGGSGGGWSSGGGGSSWGGFGGGSSGGGGASGSW